MSAAHTSPSIVCSTSARMRFKVLSTMVRSLLIVTSPTRALCHLSWKSSSARAMLCLARMRCLTRLRECRLSFSDRAWGKCMSSTISPMTMLGLRGRGSGRPDLFDEVGLQEVALLEVLELLQGDAALQVLLDLGGVVLQALERGHAPLVDDLLVADDPNLGVAADLAVRHQTAGDLTDLGDLEHFTDFGPAQ